MLGWYSTADVCRRQRYSFFPDPLWCIITATDANPSCSKSSMSTGRNQSGSDSLADGTGYPGDDGDPDSQSHACSSSSHIADDVTFDLRSLSMSDGANTRPRHAASDSAMSCFVIEQPDGTKVYQLYPKAPSAPPCSRNPSPSRPDNDNMET